MSRARLATATAVLVVATMACSSTSDDKRPQDSSSTTEAVPDAKPLPKVVQRLVITGTEYKFAIAPDPATTPLLAGWTEVRFDNRGGEAHQVMFARLKPGVDIAALAKAGAGDSSGAAAIEFVDMLGGVSYIGSGKQVRALVNLPEGVVLAMCYVPNAQGTAHALLGMSTSVAVAANPNPDASGQSSDDVVGTIRMTRDGYEIPDLREPGWYHVENRDDAGASGTGLHELAILKLDRAVAANAVDDVMRALAVNEQPTVKMDALGGLGAISAGFEGYVYLDLADGDYLAVDFMPDARKPRPHLLDGYHAQFSV